MRRRIPIAVLALAALLPVTACNADATDPNDGHGDFNVTIGAGVNPSYTWDAGKASSVGVMRTSAPGRIVWTITSDAGIASPVTHGTVPAGASVVTSVETTLVAGASYRVSVEMDDGRIGWAEFVPN